ncbi:MAG: Asp-tRNA(Asn)/Glu-tRNA(Gln) amidotransferase GatCAB subunit B, partial [Candidatus Accumulibacter sp.]|nr:Asp-tRNA(Asn)/Glu-tRNA(Gln) amidotransferase GatCAB subunit B [Accumulibacter sp.]
DANVSVRRVGEAKLGTRREIKNLNSFRFMQQAIEYEVQWQIATLEDGGTIEQATVLFDPGSGETRAMRSKEDAHDYRYFPDPDLLPLLIDRQWVERVGLAMPELPAAKRQRLLADYALSAYDAAFLTSSLELAAYFEATVAAAGRSNAKTCANWLMVDLTARLNKDDLEIGQSPVAAAQLGGLIARIGDGTISTNIARKVFDALWTGDGSSADEIISRHGWQQISDSSALESLIDDVLAANAAMVAEFRAGKERAFNALVGQAMKATRGKANPQQVSELLRKKLA